MWVTEWFLKDFLFVTQVTTISPAGLLTSSLSSKPVKYIVLKVRLLIKVVCPESALQKHKFYVSQEVI